MSGFHIMKIIMKSDLLKSVFLGLKGDTSGRTKPPVDLKTKVVFYGFSIKTKELILKRSFCVDVSGRFGPT